MVEVLPTPGCAIRKQYRFGNSIPFPVDTNTRSSIAAAIAEIAAHRRNISGESSCLVFSTNDSIQEPARRSACPFVFAGVIFEPVGVRRSIIFTFIETDFGIIGDTQDTAAGERDFFHEVSLEPWDDFVL